MGSPDLHEFVAAHTQNLYARRSSVLCSRSVHCLQFGSSEIVR
jgi:hypothetical protein